jgi:hypothetical protein
MGLVYRNSHVYYYESSQQAGKVVTRYLASGERAVAIAALNQESRRERKRLRDAMQ